MKNLIIGLYILIITGCIFETEVPGDIGNGRYVANFDSLYSGQFYESEWQMEFVYQRYYLTEVESRWDVMQDGTRKIWMRMVRKEQGAYSIDSGRIIYRGIKFGIKDATTRSKGEEGVLKLKPSDVKMDMTIDVQIDSIKIQGDEMWKSVTSGFNSSDLYSRNRMFRFHKY